MYNRDTTLQLLNGTHSELKEHLLSGNDVMAMTGFILLEMIYETDVKPNDMELYDALAPRTYQARDNFLLEISMKSNKAEIIEAARIKVDELINSSRK